MLVFAKMDLTVNDKKYPKGTPFRVTERDGYTFSLSDANEHTFQLPLDIEAQLFDVGDSEAIRV